MAKPELRARARQLRMSHRMSNREILRELENAVNLSTVTRWLKDIPLTTAERTAKRLAGGRRASTQRVGAERLFQLVAWDKSLGVRSRGQLAELKVQQRALQLGVTLSRPTMDAKYDFIVDTGGRLERAQVKFASGASSNSSGAVIVRLSRRGKRLYKAGSIDCVLVYIPMVDQIVKLAPPDFEGKTNVTIRLEPALTGHKHLIYAHDRLW